MVFEELKSLLRGFFGVNPRQPGTFPSEKRESITAMVTEMLERCEKLGANVEGLLMTVKLYKNKYPPTLLRGSAMAGAIDVFCAWALAQGLVTSNPWEEMTQQVQAFCQEVEARIELEKPLPMVMA